MIFSVLTGETRVEAMAAELVGKDGTQTAQATFAACLAVDEKYADKKKRGLSFGVGE